jgi:NADH-quinone oxidoreductase subunit I
MSAPGRPDGEVRSAAHEATPMAKTTYRRKQYWNEPEMGWYERAYLFEILRGLAITGGVFLRNMGKWVTGRKGALTTYYPEETRADYAQGNRGKHVLTQRPDGSPQCVACNMCATVCPLPASSIGANRVRVVPTGSVVS